MIVALFGDIGLKEDIYCSLYNELEELIEQYGADLFFVGNAEGFDAIAEKVLYALSDQYPHIRYRTMVRPPLMREEDLWKRKIRMIDSADLVVAYGCREYWTAILKKETVKMKKQMILYRRL